MPVSDNERMAIQHRLAKKKRAELIVRKLEEMEKMSRATDKKIQKRYQRMLMNLITSTAAGIYTTVSAVLERNL